LFPGRIRTDGTESWSPSIVLCSDVPKTSKVADRLVALAGNGGQGIAVVVDGSLPGARWGFTCSAGSISMSPLNLRVRSAAPAEEDVAAVEAILEEHDVEASEVDETEAESVEPDPVPDAVEGQPDGKPVEQAPTTEHAAIPDVVASAEPRVAPTELDLRASPHELAQPPRPFQPGTYDVEVRVLGPVEIVGGDHPVEPGKPTEVVVYLATHPAGVDSDRLRTALWPRNKLPAPKTFSNAVSKARLALGARHLPHATNERYRLEPTVTTDLARFEAMARYAHRQQGPEAIDTLRAALELIRGAPYTAVHGFHWAPSEGLVGHAEATVVDVAHRLAQLCLEAGDPGGAEWAAHHGLLASPGNEALFRDRMEAAYAAGDPARVEAVMDELCDFIEGDNPYDTLHPDTIATYEKLSKRRRHEAAAG
jgi:nucleotide-binding universal stress UspA family protein